VNVQGTDCYNCVKQLTIARRPDEGQTQDRQRDTNCGYFLKVNAGLDGEQNQNWESAMIPWSPA
jgi:hypothetical protein